jgi:DHA3 family macrolide efflux protein-like MFS transporter
MQISVSPFFVAYIAANQRWLGNRPDILAWIECSFFIGMALASYWVGRWNVRAVGKSFIAGIAAVGATVVAMGYSASVPLFIGWNLVAGLALPFAQIPLASYLQVSVPDAFRGRVNSLLGMINIGIMPIGMGLGGWLIERVGLTESFVLMGVGMFLAAVLGLAFPSFRDARISG